jgi:hypothetical protein
MDRAATFPRYEPMGLQDRGYSLAGVIEVVRLEITKILQDRSH